MFLAVGCDDPSVDIYSISPMFALTRIGYCRDIPSVVTHMDWSTDGKYLQVREGPLCVHLYRGWLGVPIAFCPKLGLTFPRFTSWE